MKRFERPHLELMLDSGQFSVYNRQEPDLNLLDYIKYIKRNKHQLFSYVNLDSIPGQFGVKRTLADVENSARKSYDNLQEMKSHGLSPIPVFHAGERFYWLERMLKDGETYIGFSLSKDSTVAKDKYLDQLFSMICDAKGQPLIRTHGFALTRPFYILRYPWFTVDSTTWSLDAGMGHMLVPQYRDGMPDYSLLPEAIAVTGINQANSNQLEALGDNMHDLVSKYLEEVLHMEPADLRYSTDARRKTYIIYYLNLIEHASDVVFRHRSNGLVKVKPIKIDKPVARGKLRLMFATSAKQHRASDLLNEFNVKTRLLSYYELRDQPDDDLAEYVRTGTMRRTAARTNQRFNSDGYWNMRRLMLRDHLNKPEPTGETP